MSPFQRIFLFPANMEELKIITKTLVDANFDRYQHFTDVDPNTWKLVQMKNNIRVYTEYRQRRQFSRFQSHSADDLQSILCVGSAPGTLDDVMYDIVGPVFETAQSNSSSRNDLSNVALLSTVQDPTVEDPFNSVAIKWMELDIRRRSMGLVKNRDYVYVESTGVKDLPSTERVGFHLMHSVDTPEAHNLPGRVRAKLSVCFFFRPLSETSVSVYAMGMMDPMSDGVRRVVVPRFIRMLLSMFKHSQDGTINKFAETMGKSYSEFNQFRLGKRDSTCITCDRRMWSFRRLLNPHIRCNLCLGYLCSSCKIEQKPNFQASTLNISRRKAVFCFSCLRDALAAGEFHYESSSDSIRLVRPLYRSDRMLRSPNWSITRATESSANFTSSSQLM